MEPSHNATPKDRKMTKTQQIIEQVKAGTHCIESYSHKRGQTIDLKMWREKLGRWERVAAPTACLRQAAKQLSGQWTGSVMRYTAA
jgi:hypothetical protein